MHTLPVMRKSIHCGNALSCLKAMSWRSKRSLRSWRRFDKADSVPEKVYCRAPRSYAGECTMQQIKYRKHLAPPTTVVVKVGSRIVTPDRNLVRTRRIHALMEDIALLKKAGVSVALVSSGAIAHGMLKLGLESRPRTIPLQQACAGIGQITLMHMYENLFAKQHITIGQVLLTWDDLREKKRYLNLRNALFQLLAHNAVPIINENDSVGVEEIRFGDNDTLGAQVGLLLGAELFVNLSDINGLYDRNPREHSDARHIPLVEKITPSVHQLAKKEGNSIGVGGMVTKLRAADMVTRSGMYALIGDGYHGRLCDVLSLETAGTLFLPSKRKMRSRHRWIAFTGKSHGTLQVDEGAKQALCSRGKSLLSAGIRDVGGTFRIGQMVDIHDKDGYMIARGMVNYSSHEIRKIMGRRSNQIENLLGQKAFDEVVHRNNMVVVRCPVT
ncbi:MAG: glutamate 5-kinase [Chitinivibrionales bacterium]|nr:glutamate 5-kinase [Chitinivibrionales bacterium]MBD3357449.1 glutamate 5-kinase [Chitinivibrionales bacterium]